MTPPRILIGEQDPATATTLAGLFARHGYVTLGPTTSCRETLERAEADRPDVAVLRLDLEGACDGADAASLLGEGHGIPVILLARNGDATRLDPARRSGVSFLLPHPPDNRLLLAAVETSLARKRLETTLVRAKAQSRAVFAAAPTALFLLTPDGRLHDANPAGEHLLGRSEARLAGLGLPDLLAAEDAPVAMDLLEAARSGETGRAHVLGCRPDGAAVPLSLTLVRLPPDEDGPGYLLEARPGNARDARPLLPDMDLERCPEGFFVLDAMERLLATNVTAWRMFGLCHPPQAGIAVRDILPEDLVTSLARDVQRVIAWNEPVKKEVTVSLDGQDKTLLLSLFPMGHDEATRLAGGLVADITDRKLLENQLAHMAFHDPLTGLPNRTLCLDRIRQAIERSKRRDNYQYAVIFLDLDRFKLINDSLGHHMGDRLLEGVAGRLRECVRGLDTVSRLGGDEFVVLLEETGSYREIVRIIKRIRRTVGDVFELCDHDIHVTCSMGIVISPCHYDKPEELLRNANIALHRAKSEGRNRFKVFNTRMLEDAIRLMDLENDLRLGLKRGEFFLDYQPILSLCDRRLRGFEALVRWRRPGKGVASPMEFIPVAEDTGLIVPLGLWVLEEACQTMAAWQAKYPEVRSMSMSVNLSARQLTQPTLVEDVESILHASGLDPRSLKLEITETVIMDNPELSILRLKRLKGLGVRLSVDDFGTGYSSLSYLQRFPIDTLKVDRSFVSDIEASENRKIVGAVVALAHSLGLDVVAEGVEVETQSDVLNAFSCEAGQGFLFSRPVCREEVEKMLGKNAPAA